MYFCKKLRVAILVFVITLHSMCCGHSDEGGVAEERKKANESRLIDLYSLIDVRMPGVRTTKEDEYLCYGWKVPDEEQYIVKYEALADATVVHHILLFGCHEVDLRTFRRDCYSACENSAIMYAWAQNAPSLHLPKDVGFRIGKGSNVQFIVMQVHYRMPMKADDPEDHSGVRLTITPVRQPFIGGVLLALVNHLTIPAHSEGIHGDVSCQYKGKAPIYPFGYRTHAHALSRVITGYHVNDSFHSLAKGNPHWPQAFYPITSDIVVKHGDYLLARCTFDAKNKSVDTHIGSTHNDEMCNLYIMYYTENGGSSYYLCMGDEAPDLVSSMPPDSDVALPSNPALEDEAVGHVHKGIEAMPSWPAIMATDNLTLGQISGVAVDVKGHIHIFHRGSRVWDNLSFNSDDKFKQTGDGPIHEKTLVELDPISGRVISQWGADIFYMPHGLEIDGENNVWVTDVALHQVMKFSSSHGAVPTLVLGTKFEPGSDSQHFCKPTDVAVLTTGEFFVADGYCNNRVIKFSKTGEFLMHWGSSSSHSSQTGLPPPGSFWLPHSLTVDTEHHLMCVADRQNARIQCFDFDGRFVRLFQRPELLPTTYAVTFCPANGYIYAVNNLNEDEPSAAVLGSIIDSSSGRLVGTWQPKSTGFTRPHDVAVSLDGRYIYVAEIGPNHIWQFFNYTDATATVHSVKKGGATDIRLSGGGSSRMSVDNGTDETANKRIEENASSQFGYTATLILIAFVILILAPVVITVIVTVCVRCSRRKRNSRHSLKHHGTGFKPLTTSAKVYLDDPDTDDSDTEEFSVPLHGASNRATPLARFDKRENGHQ